MSYCKKVSLMYDENTFKSLFFAWIVLRIFGGLNDRLYDLVITQNL